MSLIRVEENKERHHAVLHFCDFVERSGLPDEIKEALKQASITKVEVSTAHRQWVVHLILHRYIGKRILDGFSREVAAQIPGLETLVLAVTYASTGLSADEVINQGWEDVVQTMAQEHPGIMGWLVSASRSLDDSKLRIFVRSQVGLDLFHQKQVPGLLADVFSRKFGLSLKITCHLLEDGEEQHAEWVSQVESEYCKALQTMQEAGPSPDQAFGEKNAHRTKGKAGVQASGTSSKVLAGKVITEAPVPIQKIIEEERNIIIQGNITQVKVIPLKTKRILVVFDLTDLTDSITVKYFEDEKLEGRVSQTLAPGVWVKIRGSVREDRDSLELTVLARDINIAEFYARTDNAPEKRVELHLHTKMSAMDGMTDISAAIKTAAQWGHRALAITDHGVVQAYPDAYEAGKKYGIKIIFGLEGYLVADGKPIVTRAGEFPLGELEFVVFDLETTGLSPTVHEIIEIGAVRIKEGQIVDRFSRFVRPGRGISEEIRRLTGISAEMVADAAEIKTVLPEFIEFAGSAVLVAHNADFDAGFVKVNLARLGMPGLSNPILDTLGLARGLLPKMKNHKLKNLVEEFSIPLENHHRAADDAEATALVLLKLLSMLPGKAIYSLNQVNSLAGNINMEKLRPYHIVILVQNMVGLRNLYELVTMAHLNYYYRNPRIPRSELIKRREGLILGSACEAGELIAAYLDGADQERLEEIASFYDYLEIQPHANNEFLVRQGRVDSIDFLKNMNREITQLGSRLKKPVVATGDVHFLDDTDGLFRQVLMAGQGYGDVSDQAPLYFKTTDEFLEEFAYLGRETAKAVVVTNPQAIADQIEDLEPMPGGFYPPKIQGAEEQISGMTWEKAFSIYGDPVPEIVQKRIEKELNSIINNGFAVLYLIAQKLVKKSNEDGYLVGSRGSVGSSFVATLTGITEVNPLPPHYVCPVCRGSEFITDGSFGCGADLPDKDCPACGGKYSKDGFDTPFEVFLGFEGDKVPDIDLNFSGDYQPRAHKYTEELFGQGRVFRAGTIGTIADKTAFGFVQKYLDEKGERKRRPELDRMVRGCTGVKRTSGQHPGGVMVVPADMDIHEFTPLQYPADDKKSGIITTHFDYHSISGRIVKLDILGHDDPTVIRMLEDITGLNARTIPLDEPTTMQIFSGVEVLGVTPESIRSIIGTYGIPEFGTKFVRQMLEDTRPTTFSELVRISGFSHGTNVWLNNAQDLIREGTCKLSEAISARDDIMIYLIYKGLEPKQAFKIMEGVRKGKGVKPEDEKYMLENKVPEWYVGSCKKIEYMFPKAHAVAYVMMAYRIAFFKVHYPLAFYATYFTVRADEFDADIIVHGPETIKRQIEEVESKGNKATAKEKNLMTILEVALEMYERGIKMKRVDLELSQAEKFLITEEGLLPPFVALQGLGKTAAQNIVKAREQKQATSIEDLRIRAKLSKTVIEIMVNHGCLNGLPQTDQLSLF